MAKPTVGDYAFVLVYIAHMLFQYAVYVVPVLLRWR